jgi:hypothetical protein
MQALEEAKDPENEEAKDPENGRNLYVKSLHRQVHRRTWQWRRRQDGLWVLQ